MSTLAGFLVIVGACIGIRSTLKIWYTDIWWTRAHWIGAGFVTAGFLLQAVVNG